MASRLLTANEKTPVHNRGLSLRSDVMRLSRQAAEHRGVHTKRDNRTLGLASTEPFRHGAFPARRCAAAARAYEADQTLRHEP
jgi:hypothetical protein